MARRIITIDEKIERAQKEVIKAKAKYDAAVNELKELQERKKEIQSKELLEAFREKGWAVREEDGRWHFTVSGFLLSNRLISILLETQANTRLDSTPWMYRPDREEEELSLPKGETEVFTDLLKKYR